MKRERMVMPEPVNRRSFAAPIVATAIVLAAVATSASHARTQHRGSATATTSGAPSAPSMRPATPGDARPSKEGEADRHHERNGDHDRGDRGTPRGPTNVVAPADVDRIDGVMFGNRGRSFKQRALIVWPNAAPFRSGATTAVGTPVSSHGPHRHFAAGSAPHDATGRNAIGMTRLGPTGERPRDHDMVGLPVGPGAIGARIEPHRFEGLHPMIHPAAKVDAVISGTGVRSTGGGVGHMVPAPAVLGGPARNVAGIGGPPLARPRR